MADVYEKNLSQKTTLAMTDYLRVVGSNNVSYKQLVSDVANKIITQYTGASLAGSNQSVKAALDSLNSKLLKVVYINGETTFAIPSSYRGILKILDSTVERCGLYFVVSIGSGAVATGAIKAATGISITEGTNTLTITPTTGTRAVIFETYSATAEPS